MDFVFFLKVGLTIVAQAAIVMRLLKSLHRSSSYIFTVLSFVVVGCAVAPVLHMLSTAIGQIAGDETMELLLMVPNDLWDITFWVTALALVLQKNQDWENVEGYIYLMLFCCVCASVQGGSDSQRIGEIGGWWVFVYVLGIRRVSGLTPSPA